MGAGSNPVAALDFAGCWSPAEMSLDLIWMSSDLDHHGSVTATPRCRHVLSDQMQKKIFLSRTGIEPATTKIQIHNGIRTCDYQIRSDQATRSTKLSYQIRSVTATMMIMIRSDPERLYP